MADPTKNSHDQHHSPDVNPNVSHERGDLDIFQITAFGVGLFVSCVVVAIAMWAMFKFFGNREDHASTASPMAKERPLLPPEPRLSGVVAPEPGKTDLPLPVRPHVELDQLRADEDAILNNYGLLDPAKGVARIPIDVAIDLVAKKGLPSKPSTAGADNEGFRMIPSDASGGRTLEKISQ